MRHLHRVKRTNKKNDVEKHFAIRCIQRIGYVPDFRELVKSIQQNQLEFHDRQSNRITRWKWVDPISGIRCILPYDNQRKQVVTILFDWDNKTEIIDNA